MSLSREQAAQILGMRSNEIIELEPHDDAGTVVTTHDGQQTLITHAGKAVPLDQVAAERGEVEPLDADPGRYLVGEHGPEPLPGVRVDDAGIERPIVPGEVVERPDGSPEPVQVGGFLPANGTETPLPPIVEDDTTERTVEPATAAASAEPVEPVEPVAGVDDQAADDDADAVPGGNADAVLAWVGDDHDRARRALDAEQARPKPRGTVIAPLERIAGQQ